MILVGFPAPGRAPWASCSPRARRRISRLRRRDRAARGNADHADLRATGRACFPRSSSDRSRRRSPGWRAGWYSRPAAGGSRTRKRWACFVRARDWSTCEFRPGGAAAADGQAHVYTAATADNPIRAANWRFCSPRRRSVYESAELVVDVEHLEPQRVADFIEQRLAQNSF